MDSIQVFGHRDRPECFFLRTESGDTLAVLHRAFLVVGFKLDPRLFIGTTQLFHFQDGVLHLTIFIDEEQMKEVKLAAVPNCDGIHKWISRTNQLLMRR